MPSCERKSSSAMYAKLLAALHRYALCGQRIEPVSQHMIDVDWGDEISHWASQFTQQMPFPDLPFQPSRTHMVKT
jgi:hypothetical protein